MNEITLTNAGRTAAWLQWPIGKAKMKIDACMVKENLLASLLKLKSKMVFYPVQWKLDLADTSLAENLGLKDTLKKIWATVFDF